MNRIHKTFYNAHFETRQYLQSYFKVLIDKKGRILKFPDAFLKCFTLQSAIIYEYTFIVARSYFLIDMKTPSHL